MTPPVPAAQVGAALPHAVELAAIIRASWVGEPLPAETMTAAVVDAMRVNPQVMLWTQAGLTVAVLHIAGKRYGFDPQVMLSEAAQAIATRH